MTVFPRRVPPSQKPLLKTVEATSGGYCGLTREAISVLLGRDPASQFRDISKPTAGGGIAETVFHLRAWAGKASRLPPRKSVPTA